MAYLVSLCLALIGYSSLVFADSKADLLLKCSPNELQKVDFKKGTDLLFSAGSDCAAIGRYENNRVAWKNWLEEVSARTSKLGSPPLDFQAVVDFNTQAEDVWNSFYECFLNEKDPKEAARHAFTIGRVPRRCRTEYKAILDYKESLREFLNTSPEAVKVSKTGWEAPSEWLRAKKNWQEVMKSAPSYHPLLVELMLEFTATHRVFYDLDQGNSPSQSHFNQTMPILGFGLVIGAMSQLDGTVVGSQKEKRLSTMLQSGMLLAVIFGNKLNDHRGRYDSNKFSANLYMNSLTLLADRGIESCADFGFWPLAAGGVTYGIQWSQSSISRQWSYFDRVDTEASSLAENWYTKCNPTIDSKTQSAEELFQWYGWKDIVRAFRKMGERK